MPPRSLSCKYPVVSSPASNSNQKCCPASIVIPAEGSTALGEAPPSPFRSSRLCPSSKKACPTPLLLRISFRKNCSRSYNSGIGRRASCQGVNWPYSSRTGCTIPLASQALSSYSGSVQSSSAASPSTSSSPPIQRMIGNCWSL
ncbi:hypothetical protein D3C76_1298180 [compost metagenome]